MESVKAYLRRKSEELRLLDDCLEKSLALAAPRSIDEVIELKFKLTAALRAQHDLSGWTTTETAWSHRRGGADGPFRFQYDYQRADLDVTGPSFYDVDEAFRSETIYTSSGMASISALMLAFSHVFNRADITVLPGTYGETLEFIEGYASHLRHSGRRDILSLAIAAHPSSGFLRAGEGFRSLSAILLDAVRRMYFRHHMLLRRIWEDPASPTKGTQRRCSRRDGPKPYQAGLARGRVRKVGVHDVHSSQRGRPLEPFGPGKAAG
jgi:hypothetical protein